MHVAVVIMIIYAHRHMAKVMSSDLVVKNLILTWHVQNPAGIAFPQLPEGVGTSARAL